MQIIWDQLYIVIVFVTAMTVASVWRKALSLPTMTLDCLQLMNTAMRSVSLTNE